MGRQTRGGRWLKITGVRTIESDQELQYGSSMPESTFGVKGKDVADQGMPSRQPGHWASELFALAAVLRSLHGAPNLTRKPLGNFTQLTHPRPWTVDRPSSPLRTHAAKVTGNFGASGKPRIWLPHSTSFPAVLLIRGELWLDALCLMRELSEVREADARKSCLFNPFGGANCGVRRRFPGRRCGQRPRLRFRN